MFLVHGFLGKATDRKEPHNMAPSHWFLFKAFLRATLVLLLKKGKPFFRARFFLAKE